MNLTQEDAEEFTVMGNEDSVWIHCRHCKWHSETVEHGTDMSILVADMISHKYEGCLD